MELNTTSLEAIQISDSHLVFSTLSSPTKGSLSPGKRKGLALTELRHGRGRLESDLSPHTTSRDLHGGEIQAPDGSIWEFFLSSVNRGTRHWRWQHRIWSNRLEIIFITQALVRLHFYVKNLMKSLRSGRLGKPCRSVCIPPATPRALL